MKGETEEMRGRSIMRNEKGKQENEGYEEGKGKNMEGKTKENTYEEGRREGRRKV